MLSIVEESMNIMHSHRFKGNALVEEEEGRKSIFIKHLLYMPGMKLGTLCVFIYFSM